jgi:hypothetical protein
LPVGQQYVIMPNAALSAPLPAHATSPALMAGRMGCAGG